jgi:hypothetical protein
MHRRPVARRTALLPTDERAVRLACVQSKCKESLRSRLSSKK